MKYLEILRAQLDALNESRAAKLIELEAIPAAAVTESRGMNDAETADFEARKAEVVAIDAERAALDVRIAELAEIEARTAELANKPALQVIRKDDPADVLEDRAATPQQLADALTRSVEAKVDDADNLAHVRKLALRHKSDLEWARGLVLRASDVYESAWSKILTGRELELTAEERTALSTVTNANGNFLVPTHLDPTVILSNDGSSNAIRALARVVTLTRPGDTSWQGITSAGVSASFDTQLAEVSDDSPTFAQPSIAVHSARAFVQGSMEVFEDVSGLAADILMMFADAKDRLEGTKHATGTGTDEPWGIFAALDANTNVEVISTTAATIGEVDINSIFRQVPVRFRKKGTWLMNPVYELAVKRLGTAVSSSYSGDLTQAPTDRILGRPAVSSDDAPSTQTTTANDNEIVFGDFSNFVIVDKPGSMAVEYIPHLFNTTTNLPDGRRGWFASWRTGSDSVLDTAFRLLQDKTSA